MIEAYAFNQGVEIRIKAEPGCRVHANGQQLGQLLINLLKNAIESMPEGGIVYAACHSESNGYAIHIKDQGVGMSASQLEKLGSPFYSLKESGTGLGMVVCYQIVRQFGGQIKVYSVLGRGTEVVIHVPKPAVDDATFARST